MYKLRKYEYNYSMVTEGQIDQIITGISLGMPLEDMMVLSELSPQDMVDLQANSLFMARANAAAKHLTYDLLKRLEDVIDIQVSKGKDHAITWLLEKTNAHFAPKGEAGDKPGIINIFTKDAVVEASDTVEVHTFDTTEPTVTPESVDLTPGEAE